MRLLVLGGTVFVGRAVVDAALARGHEVTVFHRGQHGEDAHPAVEHLHGDRTIDLSALSGREWDAVIDTCGFSAADVGASAGALADRVGHYGFVSSVSVYREWPGVPVDEQGAVKDPDDEDTYGAGKVQAERAAEEALPGRVLIARPGLIVGPHENIGRLPYWLRRIDRGGDVLAPGSPDEQRQWIDARDLAEWLVVCAETRRTGVFNTVSTPGAFTMGDVLAACAEVTGSDARLVWTDPAAIAAAGITPWTELPIWLWDAEENTSATWRVDVSRALAAGPTCRPVGETVADTWAWLAASDGETVDYRLEYAVRDIAPDREQQALRAADATQGGEA